MNVQRRCRVNRARNLGRVVGAWLSRVHQSGQIFLMWSEGMSDACELIILVPRLNGAEPWPNESPRRSPLRVDP
jgi:hypothetical protein